MLNISLLEQQETISSFGESSSVPVTQQELTDAEDQITEEEQNIQETDTEHREEHQREEPDAKMEYGTPSGIDTIVSTCPGCQSGNSDVADAAIVDAEIVPVEATEKSETETEEEEDFSDAEETDSDGTPEMKTVILLHRVQEYLNNPSQILGTSVEHRQLKAAFKLCYPGNESFDDFTSSMATEALKRTVEALISALKAGGILTVRFIKAIFDFSAFVYRFVSDNYGTVRDLGMKIFTSTEFIAKTWSERVAENLTKVDTSKLSEMKVTILDRAAFEKTIDGLLEINKFIMSNKRMLVDNSKQATSKVAELTKKLERIGITVNSFTDEVEATAITDNRTTDDIISHGYGPKNMSSLLRKIADIHKQYRANGDSNILQFMSDMQKAVDSIRKSANSIKDDDTVNAVAASLLKMRYLVRVITVTHSTVIVLLNDFIEVAKGYDIAVNSEN